MAGLLTLFQQNTQDSCRGRVLGAVAAAEGIAVLAGTPAGVPHRAVWHHPGHRHPGSRIPDAGLLMATRLHDRVAAARSPARRLPAGRLRWPTLERRDASQQAVTTSQIATRRANSAHLNTAGYQLSSSAGGRGRAGCRACSTRTARRKAGNTESGGSATTRASPPAPGPSTSYGTTPAPENSTCSRPPCAPDPIRTRRGRPNRQGARRPQRIPGAASGRSGAEDVSLPAPVVPRLFPACNDRT
jgi:hypothetical protein